MKNRKKIIAIVGMPGAGKTVSADFFRRKNIPVLRFGDQTDIGLKELGLEKNEKNERFYREKLRKELGMAAYAIKIAPRIRKTDAKLVVLDGLMSWEEYIYLKKIFSQIKLLCIYARPKLRYRRLATRKIRPLKPQEARSRDIAEIENLNKGGPIALADYLIKNENGLKKLYEELDAFLKKELV